MIFFFFNFRKRVARRHLLVPGQNLTGSFTSSWLYVFSYFKKISFDLK
jgi:hypothetical protein